MYLGLYVPCQFSTILHHDKSGSPPEYTCPPEDFTLGALALSPSCPNYLSFVMLQTHFCHLSQSELGKQTASPSPCGFPCTPWIGEGHLALNSQRSRPEVLMGFSYFILYFAFISTYV